MDSKDDFFNAIKNQYLSLTHNQIDVELLDLVSGRIADYYYDQYERFAKQYSKSVKRYSTFHVKDLDHPAIAEMIIATLKEKVVGEYEKYAMLFLNMTLTELKRFEKSREDFHKMF